MADYGWVLCSRCLAEIGFSHTDPDAIRLLCPDCFEGVAEATAPVIDVDVERKQLEGSKNESSVDGAGPLARIRLVEDNESLSLVLFHRGLQVLRE